MLTIFPIKNIDYYKQWTQEDYYINAGDPPGQWAGYIAHVLGLSGDVEEEEYRNLMQGFSPNGREAFAKNAGKEHAPGYDLTFSAPKSVSILEVFDKYGDIKQAHENAVKAALWYIEIHAAFTRRNAQGKDKEQLSGLLSALFTHFESRAEDMQLHTHCLVFNVSQRNDQTWGAIDSMKLYQWIMASGAVYRAELAQNLRLLGYSIEADKDSFHVIGVPKELCTYYAKRDEQITKSLQRFGAQTSASPIGDHVKLYTRDKKTKTPLPILRKRWQAELNSLGFSREYAQQLQKNGQTFTTQLCTLSAALIELTKTRSTFREQDLHHHLAKQAQFTGDCAENIMQQAKQGFESDQVIQLALDNKGNQLYTTREVVQSEIQMIVLAKLLSQRSHQAPSFEILNKAIEAKQAICGYKLSDEQIEGLKVACNPQLLSILQGSAGAGKSISMEALRFAYEAIGPVS